MMEAVIDVLNAHADSEETCLRGCGVLWLTQNSGKKREAFFITTTTTTTPTKYNCA